MGSIPGLGRSPGEGQGNPLQYSCLENPMDRGAWWVTVHRVSKSRRQLKQLTHTGSLEEIELKLYICIYIYIYICCKSFIVYIYLSHGRGLQGSKSCLVAAERGFRQKPWCQRGSSEASGLWRLLVSLAEKAMTPYSSVLAWRTPGMGEPGGLPSMGLHRVGHNWCDSAAAAGQSWGWAFQRETHPARPWGPPAWGGESGGLPSSRWVSPAPSGHGSLESHGGGGLRGRTRAGRSRGAWLRFLSLRMVAS